VFALSDAVDIEIGDGTVRRVDPGDILIAEDLTGQGMRRGKTGRSRECRCSCRSRNLCC
jgi:hypothetical protein